MRRVVAPTVIASALLLVGCAAAVTPSATPPTVSDACRASLQELAEVPADDFEGADTAIVETTTACTTVAEYLAGFHENPESWSYLPDSFEEGLLTEDVDNGVIIGACLVDGTTPMCEDAAALGYDFVPGS